MAYKKQNFIDDEVLLASQLNHIEAGMVDLETDVGKRVSTNAQTLTSAQKSQARANIGAEASGTANSKVLDHDSCIAAHPDIRSNIAAVAGSSDIVRSATGEVIAVSDASARGLVGLRIFGKTIQNVPPSPNAPTPLNSAGDDGSVTVKITDGSGVDPQEFVVSTPTGIPGIPVTSGGNHTDSSGQQWLCNYVDLAEGKYVRRVGQITLDGSEAWSAASAGDTLYYWLKIGERGSVINTRLLCDRFPVATVTSSDTNAGIYVYNSSSGNGSARINCRPGVAEVTDLATWKEWLGSNKPKVYYALAEPVYENLTESELAAFATLHTNKPNTTVYNDANAEMEVAYVADTKIFVESMRFVANPVSTVWEQRMLERINQCMIPVVLLRQLPKTPNGYWEQGMTLPGINYSATPTQEDGPGLVGHQVSLSTYYSAMENPASKMYTEDIHQDNSRKSSFFGINCSGYVSYVIGFPTWVWTVKMAETYGDRVLKIETENDLFQIRRGDIVINTVVSNGAGDHVKLVQDVVYDSRTGKLVGFNVTEASRYIHTVFMDLPSFLAQMYEDQPYRVIRMEDSDYSLTVDPIRYSKSVYPDKGDGGKYSVGESVWLYVPNKDVSSVSYAMNGGSATRVSLSSLNKATVNDVTVYELVIANAGTYSVYTNLAPNDPCTVIVNGE